MVPRTTTRVHLKPGTTNTLWLLAAGYFMTQDHNSVIDTLHWSELFLQQDLTPASLIESILTFIVFGILVNTVSFQGPRAL